MNAPKWGSLPRRTPFVPPTPSGRINPGETVWMKWSGGPVVARALVRDTVDLGKCSPHNLRKTTEGYGLHELTGYWNSLPTSLYGLTIYLDREEWLDEPLLVQGLSRGSSWVVLPKGASPDRWSVESASRTEIRRLPGAALRFKVLRRDGFTCTYCGRGPPEVQLHVDHVVPFTAGGMTVIDNLKTACRDCNLGKGVMRL